MKCCRAFLIFLLVVYSYATHAQTPSNSNFTDVVLKIDTLVYKYSKNSVNFQGKNYLYFKFTDESPVCELNVYPKPRAHINNINLYKSVDYELLDSIVFLNDEYFKVRVKFLNLNKSQFLNFTFRIASNDSSNFSTEEVKLLPYTTTNVSFTPSVDELYIGEEKVFDLQSDNPENVRVSNDWIPGDGISHRITMVNDQLRIHLLPNSLGVKTLNLKLQTVNPYLNGSNDLTFTLPTITQTFKVKASRLSFLNIDRKELTYDDDSKRTGTEVIMDNNRNLILGKTYRVEDQEQPGGPLIAEIFTKSNMANDRVLCTMRTYNLHKQSEGYLYIKDGDDAKFITNINITPKTKINSIQIMRAGKDWTSNLTVYPGETIDIKIEGESLEKASFYWDDLRDITSDSAIRTDNVCYFKEAVPLDINKKQIILYNGKTNTGFNLNVREYQVPKPFDYITVNYGEGNRTFSSLNPTIIDRSTIKDIDISFNRFNIDSKEKLFGKQYIDMDIKILGKRGELIEMKSLKNVAICPGDNSPRAAYYSDKNCNNADLTINSVLSNKTYNMEDFSKIQLEIRNSSDKYSESGYEKRIEINLQRRVIFDIDVSFPAGLLIQNIGKTQAEKDALAQYVQDTIKFNKAYDAYTNGTITDEPTKPTKPTKAAFTDNLGGISLALITQFSFPDAEKVGKLKPYRVGVGFLAINAFNFSESAKRDLAVVALASLYPVKPGKVFNLPIHFGFGYKFQDKIPFIMLSPGIGIRF